MWGIVERRRPTTPQQQQCSVRLARQPNSACMQIAVSGVGDAPPLDHTPPGASSVCIGRVQTVCVGSLPDSVRWECKKWIFVNTKKITAVLRTRKQHEEEGEDTDIRPVGRKIREQTKRRKKTEKKDDSNSLLSLSRSLL